jgi:hypothetical protein
LIQIRKTSRVGRELVVLLTESIASSDLPEAVEIYDIECGDMVRKTAEEFLPVPLFPEAETFHFGSAVAHRCEAIGSTFEIVVDQFDHVCSDYLVGIDEDYFVEGEGK